MTEKEMGPIYSRSKFKSLIDSDKPVILGIYENGLNQHWLTAYGYYRTTSTSVEYIFANDGRGDNRYIVQPSYINTLVY